MSAAWCLVNRPVVDLMREPSVTSERVSQGLLGEAGQVLQSQGDWTELQLERDGYTGWTQSAGLYGPLDAARVRQFLEAANGLVVAEIAQSYATERGETRVSKLPFGVALPRMETGGARVALALPDGRTWWVSKSDVIDRSLRPRTDADGIAHALSLVVRSVGVPYLWGGRTPFGYDCSGLAQAFWGFLGVPLPRDADRQSQAGRAVEGPWAPGDLLFFRLPESAGPSTRHERICHVGIFLGEETMLHASGSARSVASDRVRSGVSPYSDWLVENLAGVRRFVPCE